MNRALRLLAQTRNRHDRNLLSQKALWFRQCHSILHLKLRLPSNRPQQRAQRLPREVGYLSLPTALSSRAKRPSNPVLVPSRSPLLIALRQTSIAS